jgi:hypothetical protein
MGPGKFHADFLPRSTVSVSENEYEAKTDRRTIKLRSLNERLEDGETRKF